MAGIRKLSRQLLYQDFLEQIMELIKAEKLWGKFLLPERLLAERCGVSRETVRKGLRVLERRGVVSRRHGQGNLVLAKPGPVRRGRGGPVIVGALSDWHPGAMSRDMIAGITDAAGMSGRLLAFANLALPASRRRFMADLARGSASGLLLAGVADRDLVEEIRAVWGGPTVLADHYFEDLPLTGVTDDSEAGARMAVAHLLALGHRRIGYVDISRREWNPWRYRGYVRALGEAGLPVVPALVATATATFEAGRQAGEHLLSLRSPPTAIFAFDDVRAYGVWRAAETRGLRVGKDLALVGYGDSAGRAGAPESLSSVHADMAAVGRAAVRTLVDLMDGKAEPGRWVKVPVELRIRKSSAAAGRP